MVTRRWTEEEILQKLERERGYDAVRTLEEFRRRLTQSSDKRARIEWRGSSKRIDEHATLWPWIVFKGIFYYPPACFRLDSEVEVPIGYMKNLAGRWNKKAILREARERTPFNDEEKRWKLIDRMNEIPGVFLPDSVNGRSTFRLHLLRNEEAIDKLVGIFSWYIGEIATWEWAPTSEGEATLDRLRRRALEAASQGDGRVTQESQRAYYERSKAVREYVLARASGTCESCDSLAPFLRPDGTPYLEPHHTIKISDEGPDHPRWVGAICPNCHREIHHGAEGKERNLRLQQRLAVLEGR